MSVTSEQIIQISKFKNWQTQHAVSNLPVIVLILLAGADNLGWKVGDNCLGSLAKYLCFPEEYVVTGFIQIEQDIPNNTCVLYRIQLLFNYVHKPYKPAKS